MNCLRQNLPMLALLILPYIAFARKFSPAVEYAMARGAEAKFCLKVCDDAGLPVSNASARVLFDNLPCPHAVYGKTDANGICVVEGKTNGNKINISVGKTGYYGSILETSLVPLGQEHDVDGGKWQPYPIEQMVSLKAIRTPVRLTSRHGVYYFPALKTWAAFDLVANDWVKPNGNGIVADIEMFLDFEGEDPVNSKRQHFKIRFLNNASNGAYLASATKGSGCPFVLSADEGKELGREFSDENECTWRKFGMLDKSVDMVFRIRSVTDAKGKLVSCYYGRLKRLDYGVERTGVGSIQMSWQYNPTPNDTNLEDVEIAKRSRAFIRQCEPPPTP